MELQPNYPKYTVAILDRSYCPVRLFGRASHTVEFAGRRRKSKRVTLEAPTQHPHSQPTAWWQARNPAATPLQSDKQDGRRIGDLPRVPQHGPLPLRRGVQVHPRGRPADRAAEQAGRDGKRSTPCSLRFAAATRASGVTGGVGARSWGAGRFGARSRACVWEPRQLQQASHRTLV